MSSEELIKFVKKRLSKGVSKKTLREVLSEVGYSDQEINEALEKVSRPEPGISKRPSGPEIKPSRGLSLTFLRRLSISNKVVRVLIIIAAVVLIGGASFFLYNKLVKPNPVSLLPQETAFYFRVKINSEHQQVKNLKTLLNKFPYYGKIANKVKQEFEKAKQENPQFKNLDFSVSNELIVAWTTPLQLEQPEPEPEQMSLALILPSPDLKKFEQLKQELKKIAEQEEIKLKKEKYRGHTITRVIETAPSERPSFKSEPELEPCSSLIRGHLVLTLQLSDIKKIIDVAEDQKLANAFKEEKAKSITSGAAYQKVKRHLPQDYLALFYGGFDVGEVIPSQRVFPGRYSSVLSSSLKAALNLSWFGPETTESSEKVVLAGAVIADRDGLRTEGYRLDLREDAFVPAQFSRSKSLAGLIPVKINNRKVIHYAEGKNISKGYQFFKKNLTKDLTEQEKRDFEQGMDEFEKELGIDLEQDIFNLLKGNYASFIMAEPSGTEIPVVGFVTETENSGQLKQNLLEATFPKSLTSPVVGALSQARSKAKDARIITEIGQLRTKAEIIYSEQGGYQNFSCQYDQEAKSLCNDITQQGGDPVIHSSYNNYCAYTPLNERGAYYCVNSAGVAKTSYIEPGQYCNASSFECPPVGEKPVGPSEQKVNFSQETINGIEIYTLPILGKFNFTFSVRDNKILFLLGKEEVPQIINSWANSSVKKLSQLEKFSSRFEQAPQKVSGVTYSRPYGYLGLLKWTISMSTDLIMMGTAPAGADKQRIIEPIFELLDRGIGPYLKVLKTSSSYSVVRDQKLVITKGKVTIKELPAEEKKAAEQFWENFDTWIKEKTGPLLGGARSKARDARIISEVGQLRAKAELISSTEGDYTPFTCGYDSETQSLCDDIDKQCPSGTAACGGDDADGGTEDVTIQADSDEYCAYSPLNTTKGGSPQYYCIDSSGVATRTTTNPGQESCTANSFSCPSF